MKEDGIFQEHAEIKHKAQEISYNNKENKKKALFTGKKRAWGLQIE